MTTDNYYNPPSKVLLQLIKEAQEGNQATKELLCKNFTPMIESSARTRSIYDTLGEDGVGIAWIIFLECIDSIAVDKMKTLTSGYFKTIVMFRLKDAVKKVHRFNSHNVYTNNPTRDSITKSFEEEFIKDENLAELLTSLKTKELEFIYLHYFKDLSLVDMAILLNQPLYKMWNRKFHIVRKLRKLYHN